MSLSETRQTNAITEYGLAESSYLQRGVDQGDSISLILWYIYYNVILSKVSKDLNRYAMKQSYLHDLTKPTEVLSLNVQVPAMTYMDDTIWLVNTKEQMDYTLKLVNSFTKMIGIKINTNKMDLLVINLPNKWSQSVNFGNQII